MHHHIAVSHGCDAQHQKPEVSRKKSQDAMFFVKLFAQHQRAEPAKRLSWASLRLRWMALRLCSVAWMRRAAPAGGARQEKIAGCDVFREAAAMFFVKQLRCFS